MRPFCLPIFFLSVLDRKKKFNARVMPCCADCAKKHKKCKGAMDYAIPKAIAAAIPAAVYDTMYRGSSITQALPLAAVAGISAVIGDMIAREYIGPMTSIDMRMLSPAISGAVFYSASKPLNLFGYNSSPVSVIAEGALYSFVGNMIGPQVGSMLSFANTPAGGAVVSTVNSTSNTY